MFIVCSSNKYHINHVVLRDSTISSPQSILSQARAGSILKPSRDNGSGLAILKHTNSALVAASGTPRAECNHRLSSILAALEAIASHHGSALDQMTLFTPYNVSVSNVVLDTCEVILEYPHPHGPSIPSKIPVLLACGQSNGGALIA